LGKSYLAKPLLSKLTDEESKVSIRIIPDGITLKKLKIDDKASDLS